MIKLYYENQYIREFVAEIEEIKEVDGKFHVALNQTAFFPGGGGQHGDLGVIDQHQVIDVYEKDGVVYHVLEKKPIKIHRVKCEIDWKRRLDGMQQHLAQHVLSGCFYQLFDANTVSVHVGKEIATVDIKGAVTEEMIRKAEKMANEAITSNMKVEMLTPTKSELKKIKIRRDLPNTNEEIRIVKIGDLDINACCGVHPASTLDLGVIKIKKWEKHKGNTRIEYLSGNRAIEDYIVVDNFANDLCRTLNCGKEDVINTINNLTKQVKELSETNRSLNTELSDYKVVEMINESKKIGNVSLIKEIFEGEEVRTSSKLAERLVANDNVIVLFALNGGEKANLIFAASNNLKDIKMNDLLKDAITLIDGKGGGSQFMAQGGGKGGNNLSSTLDYAEMKIKNIINE